MTTKMKAIVATVCVLVVAGIAGYFVWSGRDSYCQVIPKDVAALARIDLGTLAKTTDIDAQALLQTSGLAGENTETGVDFARPIYVFADGQSSTYGIVAALDDAAKLETFFTDQAAKKRVGEVEEQRGMKWVQMSSYALAAWDDDKVLVLSGKTTDEMRNLIATYWKQDKKKSILDSPLYKEAADAKEPLALLLDGKQLSVIAAEKMISQDALFAGVTMLSDIHMKLALAAKDNKATLSFDVFPQTDAAKTYYDKMNEAFETIDADLIDRGISNPIFWMGASVDGEELLDRIKQIPALSTLLVMADTQMDVSKITRALDGDIALSVDVSGGKLLNPDVLLYAETDDNDFMADVATWRMLRFHELKGGNYMAAFGRNELYFGTNKKGIFLTNKDYLADASDNTAVGLDDLKKDIKKSQFFATLDLNQLASLPALTTRSMQAALDLFKEEIASLDRLTLSTRGTHTELTLSLKKGNNLVKMLQGAALKAAKATPQIAPTPDDDLGCEPDDDLGCEPEPDQLDDAALDEYGV